jgi:DNA-binding MarR family transcriptional regulator
LDKDLEIYIQKFLSVSESFRRKFEIDYRNLTEQIGIGITRPQLYMLQFIKEQGQCKITQLAEKMEVKPSAITVMIDRLFQSNLVVRTHDPRDRRVVLVELTEEGHHALEKVKEMTKEIIGRYFSKINKNELATFIHTLEKISIASNENLEHQE